MSLQCPQCRQTITFVGESTPNELRCSSCGTRIALSGESTRTVDPESTDSGVPNPQQVAVSPTQIARGRIDDYELLGEIARGGMGVVYRARQLSLNRIVAIKMIRSGELADDEEVLRFQSEAKAAAALDHPSIVPIYEVGEQDGQHYFSMGFIDGRSLQQRLKDGPLPPRESAEVVRTIAEAVHYAHDKGIVHRDLKPANVLIDTNGQPRVTDFGLAKNIAGDSSMTATGRVLGTPGYMPPEQAAGRSHQVDRRSDVYSLGAILYCLLTGRPPFQAATPLETLKQVLEREPVPPRQLNPDVPLDLETICLKCLRKEQPARYSTARELADELQRFLDGRPIIARPLGRLARTWRWCRRKPVVAGLLAVLVVAVVALGAGFVLLTQSYHRESEARGDAEANLVKARQFVETFYMDVSDSKELLKGTPGTQRLRKRLMERARIYYQEFVEQNAHDDSLRADLAKARSRLAFIAGELGDQRVAVNEYRRAIDLYDELAADNPSVTEYRRELAEACGNLGVIYHRGGEPEKCVKMHQRAIDLERQLVRDEPRNVEFAASLAKSYSNLGSVHYETGKLPESQAAHGAALEILERLNRQHPGRREVQSGLAQTCNALSAVQFVRGERKPALDLLRKAIAIRRALLKHDPDDPEHLTALAKYNYHLGVSLFGMRQADPATAAYREAISAGERLMALNPAVPEHQLELVRAYSAIGLVDDQRGAPQDSQEAYDRGIRIAELLAERYPAVEAHHSVLAAIYNNLGFFHGRAGRLAEGLAAHNKARDILERLLRRNAEVPEHGSQLVKTCMNIAVVNFRLQRRRQALKAIERSVEICESLVRRNPAVPQYQNDLATSLRFQGDIYKEAGQLRHAVAEYRRSLIVLERLCREHPAVAIHQIGRARADMDLATVLWRSDPQAAANHAKKSVERLDGVLAREPGNPSAKQKLLDALMIAAQVLDAQSRYGDAAAYWLRTLPLVPAERRPLQTISFSLSLARSGDHGQSVRQIEALATEKSPPATLYQLAGVYAVALHTASDDRALRTEERVRLTRTYADKCLALLRRAAATGHFKDPRRARLLESDPLLVGVRSRDDFRRFALSVGVTLPVVAPKPRRR